MLSYYKICKPLTSCKYWFFIKRQGRYYEHDITKESVYFRLRIRICCWIENVSENNLITIKYCQKLYRFLPKNITHKKCWSCSINSIKPLRVALYFRWIAKIFLAEAIYAHKCKENNSIFHLPCKSNAGYAFISWYI